MNRTEHNKLANAKGTVKRARNSLRAVLQQVWSVKKTFAWVPHKGETSTFDAARDIWSAIEDCNASIEKLEALCNLDIDEAEKDPYADCGVPFPEMHHAP